MIDLFKKVIGYIMEGTCTVLSCIVKYTPVVGRGVQEEINEEVCSNSGLLKFIPDIFKNPEMCISDVGAAPWLVYYVPPCLKTHEMCSRAVEKYIHPMRDVHLKTKEMCNKAVKEYPWQLGDFSNHLKTQEMCKRAIEKDPETLE